MLRKYILNNPLRILCVEINYRNRCPVLAE